MTVRIRIAKGFHVALPMSDKYTKQVAFFSERPIADLPLNFPAVLAGDGWEDAQWMPGEVVEIIQGGSEFAEVRNQHLLPNHRTGVQRIATYVEGLLPDLQIHRIDAARLSVH